ncbi:MAG: metallophosphatase [Breznakibacter sp.]
MQTNNGRRDFIKKVALGSLALGATVSLNAAPEDKLVLTILHTNDVHSQIDPLPGNHSRFPGQGGFAQRASLIARVRAENPNTLLFDSGDIFQGTPYFNYFKGKLEISLMNKMGYDAGTIGNHEFDNGVEELARRVSEANFPFLSANYDFSGTPMQGKTRPYQLFDVEGLRIGVFGLGIELTGLVDPSRSSGTVYLDPIKKANEVAGHLKEELGCRYVICLSHLGLEFDEEKVCDKTLAKNCPHIDLILGGHTHTFLPQPIEVVNGAKTIVINQVGWAGVWLGRLDIEFDKNTLSAGRCRFSHYDVVG